MVLTGAGTAFCSGGDVENFVRNHTDVEHRRRSLRGARKLVDEILDFPLPVVAAVNGPAIGLGCTLAVLCDLVVISEEAYTAESHVAIGLVAGDGGTALWPLMMSILKATELVLLGDRIPAEEAVRPGRANRVVPADDLLNEAVAFAQRLAALPPQSVQETKRAFGALSRTAWALAVDLPKPAWTRGRSRAAAISQRQNPLAASACERDQSRVRVR